MKLLDLFCGAGGAGMGYHRAGFDVTGVDVAPQKRYPFRFVQADALEYLADHWREYDVIHASPPCQAYSVTKSLHANQYEELVGETRTALIQTGKPYVIENVPGAPLLNPLLLCGSMFGLALIRHRIFESTPVIWFPPAPCKCRSLRTNSSRSNSTFASGATAITVAGFIFRKPDAEIAMGIDWMHNRKELAQAIPPAYTHFIGQRIQQHIRSEQPF